MIGLFFVVSVSTNAQTEKKEPPPPPPQAKVVVEKVKFTPPKIVKGEEIQSQQKPPVIVDEKVNASKPKEPPMITVRGKLADEFYNRNQSVAEISRKGNIITLKMKDGTAEKYDMSKEEEDKNFNDKYGDSPIPPPPPPPKPKTETIKYKVVDEKVQVPPPPPPPKKKTKA